jgi:uncharacterized membrane protein
MQNLYGLGAIVTGLITIALVYYKPNAYWDKHSVRFVRNLIGDEATTILYSMIGLLFIMIGFFVLLRVNL